MTARTAVCLFLGLASVAAGQSATEKDLPHISDPAVLAIEMAKALVFDDRDRFTALAATRKEMETLLEAALPPSRPEERQYLKNKVAEILAERGPDFDRFQAMKRKANFKQGVAVRFELIMLDRIYVKDGMKKIRHSRVRMFQGIEGGTTESFIISLDDMFLFPRGWAFTSVSPEIGREISRKSAAEGWTEVVVNGQTCCAKFVRVGINFRSAEDEKNQLPKICASGLTPMPARLAHGTPLPLN